MPKVELIVTLDGDVRGLAQHRLSLRQFGPALTELEHAFRRTAQAIVNRDLAKTTGRYGKHPEQLDLELRAVETGCAQLAFVVTRKVAPKDSHTYLADLPEKTAREFCEDLVREARGELVNDAVRKYLQALPAGITRQKYVSKVDDAVTGTAEFGDTSLSAPSNLTGGLLRFTGVVVAVGFEPGRSEIRIQDDETGRIRSFLASPAQVNRALELRAEKVEALGVRRDRVARLVWIRPSAESPRIPSPEKRAELIDARWSAVLGRLAQ